MGIRVLMIAMLHSAKDDRIFYKEAVSLQKNGYEVYIITLTDKDGFLRDMSGNILNPNAEKQIVIQGITIIGIMPPEKILDIVLNKIFLGNFQKKFIQTIIDTQADVYHAHEPLTLRYAFKTAKKTGKKVVFDSHESWKGGTFKERWIKFFYQHKVENLITVNQGILDYLSPKMKLKNSEIVFNAALPDWFNKIQHQVHEPLILVHEGNLLFNRGLKLLLDALELLKRNNLNIHLKIIGKLGLEEQLYYNQFDEKHQISDMITFTGWIAYENVYREFENTDVGLILFTKDDPNNFFSTSNKLFNYIGAKLAIISVDIPETRRILEPAYNTMFLEKDMPETLTQKIVLLCENRDLLNKMKNSSATAWQHYNWKIEERKLLDFYKKL